MFISMSKNAQIYSNTLEDNVGGIEYFLNCAVAWRPGAAISRTMRRTTTRSSSARRATRSRAPSAPPACTSAQLAPYLNGSKNLTFSRNTYTCAITPLAGTCSGAAGSIGMSGRHSGTISTAACPSSC